MKVVARELIGRRAELKALDSELREAAPGRLRVVLVSGAAGMGKSALIRSFGDAAVRQGARLLVAECAREGSTRAFDPFLVPGSGLADVLATAVESRPSFLAAPERHRAFQAIAERLSAIGRERPVALVLEDAQWADANSAELPAYLTRRAADAPCVVVVTYRTEDASAPVLSAAISQLRSRHAIEIDVGPLTPLQVGAFIRSALDLPGTPEPALRSFVYERSEGNPLFVEELIRGLIDQGALVRSDGTWRLARSIADAIVPTSIGDTVRARAARMPLAIRRTLSAAAVMGQRFTFDLLVTIAAAPRSTVVEAVRTGIDGQLIEEVPGERLEYRFRHALIRDALLMELVGPERQDLHRAVARSLEEAAVGGRPSDPYKLAYHFDLAGDADAAVRYYFAAGRGANATFSTTHLDRALALAGPGHPDRAEILLRRASADLFSTGTDLAPALLLAEESLAHARRAGDDRGAARSTLVLGILRVRMGDVSGAEDIRRGVRELELLVSGPELAPAYVRLAHIAMLSASPDAVELAERAVELSRSPESGFLLPHALTTLGSALVNAGRREGIDAIREGLALAREMRSPPALGGALRSLWTSLLRSGAPDDELREVERMIATEFPGEGGLQFAFFDDRWDEVLDLQRTVPAGSTFAPTAELIRAYIVAGREGPDGAAPLALRAHERLEATSILAPTSALATEVLYLCGDAGNSLQVARHLARGLDRGSPLRDGAAIIALTAAVELDDASATAEWLERCSARHVLEPATAEGRRAYARGQRAVLDGRRDEAAAEFASAATGFERRGATLLARTLPRLRRAALLANSDPAAAQRELAAVMAMWRAVDAKWYLGQLREWAARHGLRGWTVSARRGPRLTPREQEVARAVAEGLTNKEIGAALGITERTAETHVQRIVTKLDLRGRSQLAAWVSGGPSPVGAR